jgi:ribosomal protein L29
VKKKDIQKLHQLSAGELQARLVEARKELVDLRMSTGREKTKDVRAIGKKRDEMARIMTILKEKEFLEEVKEPNEKI